MADENRPYVIKDDNNNNGLSAGVGGAIGAALGNGGFFGGGYGYGRGMAPGQGVADVAIQTGIQNVQNAVNQGAVAQAQGVGALGMQIGGAAAGVTGAITANTIAGLQGQNAIQQQMCCGFNSVGQQIDTAGDQTVAAINQGIITGLQTQMQTNDRLAGIDKDVIAQGYEARLLNQQETNLLQSQHAEIMAAIFKENCENRALMRQIQAENVQQKLNDAASKIASLEAQIMQTQITNAQTQYLIQQLKTTAAAAA